MVYGVTGQHQLLTEEQSRHVRRIVKRTVLRRPEQNELVSGVAFGVDTEAIIAVWGLMPFENITCVVPGTCNHNRGLVERCERAGANIVVVPNRYSVSETYLARDDKLVELVRTLLGFPRRRTFYRSGTWATINRANKAGKRVRLYPFDTLRK